MPNRPPPPPPPASVACTSVHPADVQAVPVDEGVMKVVCAAALGVHQRRRMMRRRGMPARVAMAALEKGVEGYIFFRGISLVCPPLLHYYYIVTATGTTTKGAGSSTTTTTM